VLAVLNARGVAALMPYVLVGVVLWAAVLKSGVHATLAGVVLAMAVPFRLPGRPGHSPLMEAEHALHPWVAYGILPAFAFANAGVSLQGVSLANLADPVPLGIATGLFVGKQAGVMLFGLGATRLGLVRLPAGVSLLQFYGVALLTGIGFTMSLFIGALAFDDPALAAEVRLGVLAGSVLSGLAGYGVLRLAAPSPKPAEIPAR
ncbi:MAG TPA: Na+/H+ antiporter NhaA, partial [Azospirillaceae bacterium]|nr:Na+/H+ antiporter NhaA [Azospirillaceae bacterium]